jgi:hypothetical protein
MEVLDIYGPVAVAIDSSHSTFVSYSNHVYGKTGNTCSNTNLGLIYIYTQAYLFFFIYN